MKKIILTLFLFSLLTLIPQEVSAQGSFGCTWITVGAGGQCGVGIKSCDTGYEPVAINCTVRNQSEAICEAITFNCVLPPVVPPSASVPTEPAQLFELTNVFGNALTAFLGLGGIILFVMLVTGGFQFMTAGGDPKKLAASWATITFALVGLVLVTGAYLILTFIADFTGASSILNFDVYLN